jgi:hypothetical protein
VLNGTAPLAVLAGFVTFVIGLELTEPLAQEIDHGDLTDRLPVSRGETYLRLLVVPVLMSIPFALVMGATTGLVADEAWAVVAIASVPALAAGLAGAAVNVVSGAPDPVTSLTRDASLPPEVAGTANVIKAVWPIAIATAGQGSFLVAESARRSGSGAEAATARGAIFAILVVITITAWIHRRDAIRTWIDDARRQSRTSTDRGVTS